MKKLLYSFLLIALAASLFTALQFYLYSIAPVKGFSGTGVVNIPRGSSLTKIAHILEENKLIRGTLRFVILAKLWNTEHSIKSGEYRFTAPPSPRAVLDKLIRGDVITYPVTFPEGCTIFEIARIIEEADLGSADKILKKATDALFVQSLGIDNKSLEGFLFPDTYRFTRGTTPEQIMTSMVKRFNKVFNQELQKGLSPTGLSEEQIVILASLIEKETPQPVEKPIIAGVFINRLKKRMRLECDPTVIYGIRLENPEFKGRLRKKDLKRKTLYNTYRSYGLPPGPICNPGLYAIKAALNPAKVDYLYFVSKNNGTHKFSKTFREHNKAVTIYQKRH